MCTLLHMVLPGACSKQCCKHYGIAHAVSSYGMIDYGIIDYDMLITTCRLHIQYLYTHITVYIAKHFLQWVAAEVLMLQEPDYTTAHGMLVLSHHHQDDIPQLCHGRVSRRFTPGPSSVCGMNDFQEDSSRINAIPITQRVSAMP